MWCAGQRVDEEGKLDEDKRCERADAHCRCFGGDRLLVSTMTVAIGISRVLLLTF